MFALNDDATLGRKAAERLPPAAADKLLKLLDAHELHSALIREASQAARDARDRVSQAEAQLDKVAQGMVGHQHQPGDYVLSDPVEIVQKEVDRAKSEQARLQRRVDDLTASRPINPGPVVSWVNRNSAGDVVIVECPVALPVATKNKRPADLVAEQRDGVARIKAEIRETESAVLPSSMVKERVRAELAGLAQRGRPDAMAAVVHGSGIRWPEAPLRALGESPVRVDGVDTLGLLCWLFRDELAAKLDAEIDDCADDEHALSPVDKQRRVATLQASLLEAERVECGLIDQAASNGVVIRHRNDVEPQALLGVMVTKAEPQTQPPANDKPRRSWNPLRMA